MEVNLHAPLLQNAYPLGGQQDAPQVHAHAPQQGLGHLAGRDIAVGNGEQRSRIAEGAAAIGKGLATAGKWLGKIVGGVVLGAVGGPLLLAAKLTSIVPRLVNQHLLEPRAERQFKLQNAAVLDRLAQPGAGSVLERDGLVDKLMAHARATGRQVSEQEVREMVATGEHIAGALADHPMDAESRELRVRIGNDDLQVKSSVYTTRAIGWFMMAQAAAQDLDRAQQNPQDRTSDMTTSGSFVMKDPGNRMYDFLNSAPTAAARMSTHFEERIGHNEVYNFGITTKTAQRGIEDYQSKMPGPGGTMLFDKLRPGQDGREELFVKFESVGCPPYFQSEPHHGLGTRLARFFAALDRNIGHATSFIGSRFEGGPSGDQVVKRQEHVYKGVLKEPIATPFKELVKQAIRSGVIDGKAGAIDKGMHKYGLPYVKDALELIRGAAQQHGDQALLDRCAQLQDAIDTESNRLGLASDRHGIERRGAEVHISIT